jgi:magnesium chelatase accessory protein
MPGCAVRTVPDARAGLAWERDGAGWPNSAHSRFVVAAGLRWHVQRMGQGPVTLLIHGTGASTHSWRALMPLLARQRTVVALDLPGHAFSAAWPGKASLPVLSGAVASLIEAMKLDIACIVGHSAGAAIAARLVLDGRVAPQALIGINAALLPLRGWPGLLFPAVARLMAASTVAPRLFAQRRWDASAIERLVAGTGSRLDAQGLALYGRLLRDARHAAGALDMMAGWDLRPLARDLQRLRTALTLVVGSRDKAVPPGDARRVQALLPATTPCSVVLLPHCGHLAHEEAPAAVARLLMATTVQGRTAEIVS